MTFPLRLSISMAALALCGDAYAVAPKVDFNRDVRPILSDTCFKCHGFDKASRKADLRLDVREEAVNPRHGDNHQVPIVPGDPAKSEVWKRIITDDADELMPPREPVRVHLELKDPGEHATNYELRLIDNDAR